MAQSVTQQQGPVVGGPWILERSFAHSGAYELPLRTMYSLNSATCSRQDSGSLTVLGNAFPQPNTALESQRSTATAAEQLKANLMSHMAQQPSQPASLPPHFITSFVKRCFPPELARVDFPQALTALDYLKDLEMRRRNEITAALSHLGINQAHVDGRETTVGTHSSIHKWIEEMDRKEVKVEALYSHVYLGLRRWTLVNEMSLTPFNKQNCLAMLNTLFPPSLHESQFVRPTKQLTPDVLQEQRRGFFRYITTVEKKGTGALQNVMDQHKRPGEENGWLKTREDLESYLMMANDIINECLEITGRSLTPMSPSFAKHLQDNDEESKRKVDSGVSFGSSPSGYASNRSSDQSHVTRPSTASTVSQHSRQSSKEKNSNKALPSAPDEEDTVVMKPAGSALERIARELRKIGSRTNIREESRSQPPTILPNQDQQPCDADSPPPTPGRGLRLKRSLKNLRSASRVRSGSTSRPVSRNGSVGHKDDFPSFDADAMRRQRQAWEASHRS